MIQHPIILFDGYCNLCSFWVDFILKHDKQKQFRFCALQSPVAEKLLVGFNITDNNKTVILIADDKAYVKSTAALHILKKIKSAWSLLYVFIIVPRFIRDVVYDFIAKYRYQWFGKRSQCYVPLQDERNRFIDN